MRKFMIKKLSGTAAPFMIGMVLTVGFISTLTAKQYTAINEEKQQKYIESKKQYIQKVNKDMKDLFIGDGENYRQRTLNFSDLEYGTVTNIFSHDIPDYKNTGSQGSSQSIINLDESEYNKNLYSSSTSSNIKTRDLSNANAVLFEEDSIRQEQIMNSYTSMERAAGQLFQSIAASKNYKFPCTYTATEKDAWNRSFTYTRTDDANAKLSFSLPWSSSTKKVLPLTLPEIPIPTAEIKQVHFGDWPATNYILTTTGEVWSMGRNNYGQLGTGQGISTHSSMNTWTKTNLTGIDKLITQYNANAFALTASGEVWAVGDNSYGQLGIGSTTNQNTWVKTSLTGITDIRISTRMTVFALNASGEAWVAGRNTTGELGLGTNTNVLNWTKLSFNNIKDVALTNYGETSFIVTTTGEVWGAGANGWGILGLGNNDNQNTWVKTPLTDIKKVYAGGNNHNAFALTNAGKVWATGYNGYGQLGLGSNQHKNAWEETILADVKEIILGRELQTFALTNTGDVWGTGANSSGSLGLGDTSHRYTWTKTSLSNIEHLLSANSSNTYALNNLGEVFVAGRNSYGELGIGSKAIQDSWIKLSITDVKEIGVGNLTAYLLTNGGKVWSTGRNNYGQLAQGNKIDQETWVETSLSNVKVMFPGGNKTSYSNNMGLYAVTTENELWSAGRNNWGQLGVRNHTDQENWTKSVGDGATLLGGAAPSCP